VACHSGRPHGFSIEIKCGKVHASHNYRQPEHKTTPFFLTTKRPQCHLIASSPHKTPPPVAPPPPPQTPPPLAFPHHNQSKYHAPPGREAFSLPSDKNQQSTLPAITIMCAGLCTTYRRQNWQNSSNSFVSATKYRLYSASSTT